MKPRDFPLRSLALSFLTIYALLSTVSVADETPKPNPTVQPGTAGRDVNPFIGTGGVTYLCGNNFPGATVPFGMVRLSPDTVSLLGKRATNSSGYYYGDPRILGFSHTRLAGTGATDGGNFLVIPCTAETAKSAGRGLNVAFSHEQERAFPGYYGVALPGVGITAELTATHRVGVHRYTFPARQAPHILIQITSALGKGKPVLVHFSSQGGNWCRSIFPVDEWTDSIFPRLMNGQPTLFLSSLFPTYDAQGREQPQTGAKRVIPGTRSKSVSALAKLVRPCSFIRATIKESLCSGSVCWVTLAAASRRSSGDRDVA